MVPTFSHCFYPPMTLFLAYYKYDPQTCHLQFRSLSHLQLIVEFYPLRLRWLFGYGPAIKLVRVNTTSSGTNRNLFSIVTFGGSDWRTLLPEMPWSFLLPLPHCFNRLCIGGCLEFSVEICLCLLCCPDCLAVICYASFNSPSFWLLYRRMASTMLSLPSSCDKSG